MSLFSYRDERDDEAFATAERKEAERRQIEAVNRAVAAERVRWATWMRAAFNAIDRHVPINQIPPELDAARRQLERM